MAYSANSWRANDPTLVSRRRVPGTAVDLTVRIGAPGDLLLEVASRFDAEIQDIDNARGALDDWGYAERPIRGGTQLSNHASGTALDLNATRWPLGTPASRNLRPDKIVQFGRVIAATRGVVVWGAVWSRPDPMHIELADGTKVDDCVRALAELRAYPRSGQPLVPVAGAHPDLSSGSTGEQVRLVQRLLRITVDGAFGPQTTAAVTAFQRSRGLDADGIVGPRTWTALLSV